MSEERMDPLLWNKKNNKKKFYSRYIHSFFINIYMGKFHKKAMFWANSRFCQSDSEWW